MNDSLVTVETDLYKATFSTMGGTPSGRSRKTDVPLDLPDLPGKGVVVVPVIMVEVEEVETTTVEVEEVVAQVSEIPRYPAQARLQGTTMLVMTGVTMPVQEAHPKLTVTPAV